MAQINSSSAADASSFPLITLENFVNSMNEQNGFGETSNLSSTVSNNGTCTTESPTISESSPFHCNINFSLPSNFNASVSVLDRSASGSANDPIYIPDVDVIPPSTTNSDATKSHHQCFGKKNLIVAEFSKTCDVHHVNRKPGGLASTWKLRCLECTESQVIMDLLVDYIFCFLTSYDGVHCFMIKLQTSPHELFLIPASAFKALCPVNYVMFYNSIDSYNSLLSDLSATIEEQKKIVEECFNSEILRPYKTNSSVDASKLPDSEDAQNAMAEIRRLFFLELEYEMGEFMRKNINVCSELVTFVMNYYNSRDRAYSIIAVEDVKDTYIALYNDLVNQS